MSFKWCKKAVISIAILVVGSSSKKPYHSSNLCLKRCEWLVVKYLVTFSTSGKKDFANLSGKWSLKLTKAPEHFWGISKSVALSSYLDKLLVYSQEITAAQNIAHVLDFKRKQKVAISAIFKISRTLTFTALSVPKAFVRIKFSNYCQSSQIVLKKISSV